MAPARRLLFAAALLAAAGCSVRYVTPPAPGRHDLHIAVFTADEEQGEAVLEWLEERGFDNEANHLARPGDDDPAIYWGAAPTRLVNEIAAYLEGRYGVELDREREFDRLDPAVHVHLPAAASGGTPGRSDLRVVIFTDDQERGEALLEYLSGELGFSNDENYVTDGPNEEFNIKWGAAPAELVDEIVAAADAELDVELDRQHIFEADDRDVFINLPLGAKVGTERDDFEVTLFCDDSARARRFLARLERLGYTHDENEVLTEPNDDFNIKYGGLPEELVEELAGQVEAEFGTRPTTRREFDRTSDQVFINLPARR
jgi:hypothetical protein